MTERIKEFAEQCGAFKDRFGNMCTVDFDLERFAELVRQDERNKFVKFLMDLHEDYKGDHNYYHFAANLFKEQA